MARPTAAGTVLLLLACATPAPVAPSQGAEPSCADAGPALQSYFVALNDRSEGTRRDALERCCTPSARFVDAGGVREGTAAFARWITDLRTRQPGALLEFGPPEQHHCSVRVGWTATLGDGSPPVEGVDFIDLEAGGRFVRVVSFSAPVLPPER